MKSRKKILHRLFIAALVLTILGTVYVHYGILPGKARLWAIAKADALTHKKITFDKALYLPFHGFIFYGLDVRESDGTPLFHTRRFSVDVKILPFLEDKKIVIANIRLDSPVYAAVLEPKKIKAAPKPVKTEISGQIDVPVVSDARKIALEDLEDGPDAFLPENVYIEQIQITEGFVTIQRTENAPPVETLSHINVRMAFQKPPYLYFDGSLKLGQTPYAAINLEGVWNLKQANYHFNLSTEWDKIPGWLKDYQKGHFLVLQESRVKLVTELQSIGGDRALFHAGADLKDARLRVKDGAYNGRMQIDAKGVFNFDTKKVERYKGTLRLLDVNILNLSKKLPEIDHVEGGIDFQPDLLTVRQIKGSYRSVPFDARGTITSFRDLLINGEIHMSVSLEKILALIPSSQKSRLKDFDIQGGCEALTTVQGSLKKASELSTEYKMALRGASLVSKDGKIRLDGLSCDLFSGRQGLKISKASFDFQKKTYRMNLFMPKDPDSPGRIDLDSDELSLKTAYYLREGRVLFKDAQASLPGITARFKGELYPIQKPALDIQGSAALDLERLARTLPPQQIWLKNARPEGTLAGTFRFKGAWNNLLHAQIAFNGQSASVLLAQNNIRLDHPALDAGMEDGVLNISHLTAGVWGGMFGMKGFFDFNGGDAPFDASFYFNNLDLRKVAENLQPQNKKLSGSLILQSSLRGLLKKQETWTGKGLVSVKNGDLWETSQFKAMGNLPLVKVEGLDWVIFREMQGNFQIRDKKVRSEDLTLSSDTVHLNLRGTASFDQQLDMLMDIEYTNAVFLGAEDAGGLAPMMVNQAADLISQYQISGTFKNPKYEKAAGVPVVSSVGKKLGNFLQGLTS